MDSLPQVPDGLSPWWVLVGMAILAIGFGMWRAWVYFSPAIRAEREEAARRGKRTRHRLGRSYDWGEIAEQELYNGRTDRRKHDDEQHPDGEGAIGVRELPPMLRSGIREWSLKGEEDSD